jgi:hypothetical protein
LAGIALLLTGFGLQALALANGPVALVQPIVITELAFAIPLGLPGDDRDPGVGAQDTVGIPDPGRAGVSERRVGHHLLPTSGSGNMIPGPMNEELQQDLAAVGIHVTLQPMEWATMLTQFETGHVPGGSSATNISLTFQQEDIWAALFLGGSPINVGHYNNSKVDSLLMQAQVVVDPAARAKIYSEAGDLISQTPPGSSWSTTRTREPWPRPSTASSNRSPGSST